MVPCPSIGDCQTLKVFVSTRWVQSFHGALEPVFTGYGKITPLLNGILDERDRRRDEVSPDWDNVKNFWPTTLFVMVIAGLARAPR